MLEVAPGGGKAPGVAFAAAPPAPASHLHKIRALYLGGAEGHDAADGPAGTEILLGHARGTDAETADDDLNRELERLSTGDEAVKLFARKGGFMNCKYVYCNRGAPGGGLAPYALSVVPQERAHPEHFIISASGVIHVSPGQLSEHTSLFEWMRGSSMFSVLASMPYFRLYGRRKSFIQWRAAAQHEHYRSRREQLRGRCLLAKPRFAEPLVTAYGLARAVQEGPFVQFKNRAYRVQEVAGMCSTAHAGPAKTAHELVVKRHGSITAILDRLVSCVQRAPQEQQQQRALQELTRKEGGPSKSMAGARAEARSRARREHVLGHDILRLGDCVRVVDYVYQASQVDIVLQVAAALRQWLSARPRLFVVSVAFGADGAVVLDPNRGKFYEAFGDLWSNVLSTLKALPAVASLSEYKDLRGVSEHKKMRGACSAPQLCADFARQFQAAVCRNYDDLRGLASELYAPLLPIHRFGLAWDEERFLAQAHAPDELAHLAGMMRDFREDAGRIRLHGNAGPLGWDAAGLRDRLARVPERVLGALGRMSDAQMDMVVTVESFRLNESGLSQLGRP